MPLSDPCFRTREPVEPPPGSGKPPTGPGGSGKPPPPGPCGPDGKPQSWCELAMAAFWRAWFNWNNVLGKDYSSYKVGTRALTTAEEVRAWNALDHAIQMVRAFCGDNALPAGLGGQSLAIRGVISDV